MLNIEPDAGMRTTVHPAPSTQLAGSGTRLAAIALHCGGSPGKPGGRRNGALHFCTLSCWASGATPRAGPQLHHSHHQCPRLGTAQCHHFYLEFQISVTIQF